MQFVLDEVLNAGDALRRLPAYADLDTATISAVFEEAGKFAAEILAPLNRIGDVEGCSLDHATHEVRTPSGFKEAYMKFVEGGWPALSCDPEYGGQGLPVTVNQCVNEMLNSANQAWTMYHGLSRGVYACLRAHGSTHQKALYLPKLAAGQWAGTMCLTESHCGTDLGLLRTRAEPLDDGSYRLFGQKIFISAGEHDMAENIVHLVLARLPDSPPGARGISLFVVPKFVPNDDGSLGVRNAIVCTGLEVKMGIHGNATAELSLDGARGWLVGQRDKGLSAMFVMMNAARLAVGVQSLGVNEVAYQNAVHYAKDRLQMRALSGPKAPDKPADPIIVHPDVRKMLMTARAYAEGGRALAIYAALLVDTQLANLDADARRDAEDRVALLTPIIKAFLTDNAWISTSHCLQVFGGHGYIAEWGMEQLVRDSRINMIYEGTNTIQSLDLLGRKVLADGGATLKKVGREISEFIEEERADNAMQEFARPLEELGEEVTRLTMEIGVSALANADEVGAAAVDYLRVCGHLLFAYLWARMAKTALKKLGSGDPFYSAKLATARFYFAKLLPETAGLIRSCRAGVLPLMAMEESSF